MFNRIRMNMGWGFIIIAVIVAVVFFVLPFFLVGCGEEGVAGSACVGEVTKTYTTTSVSGGFGGVPATSSTQYRIVIKRSDGTYCSQKVKKDDWFAINEGDTYG